MYVYTYVYYIYIIYKYTSNIYLQTYVYNIYIYYSYKWTGTQEIVGELIPSNRISVLLYVCVLSVCIVRV